jgi:hypothetical protein
MVLFIGGKGATKTKANAERYDAASGQGSAINSMEHVRKFTSACVIEGDIYVTGGSSTYTARLASVEKYSVSTDTWSSVAPIPAARSAHATISMGPFMFVIGGTKERGTAATVFKYDKRRGSQGVWNQVAPTMPEARELFAACAVGTNIYIFGGLVVQGEEKVVQSTVFKYATLDNEWSALPPMPRPSFSQSACELGGMIYIVGIDRCEVLRFDPVAEEWSALAPTMVERAGCCTFVSDNVLYAAGGRASLTSVERYDVEANTWTTAGHMLEERKMFATVVVPKPPVPFVEHDFFELLIIQALRRELKPSSKGGSKKTSRVSSYTNLQDLVR